MSHHPENHGTTGGSVGGDARRRWIPLISILLGSLSIATIIAVGAGEAFVRYRERTREVPPDVMPFLYYRHTRLPHALVRGSDYFGWVRINPYGFRGSAPSDEWFRPSSSVRRILVAGASTTFDTQVSDDSRTWPARLQHWLNRSNDVDSAEVINGGTPGYRVIDNTIRFLTELRHYCPDLLVVYHTHNDLLNALNGSGAPIITVGSPRPDEVPAVAPWTRWLRRNSLLYGKVLARLKAMRRARRPRAGGTPDRRKLVERLEEGADRFGEDLDQLLRLAREEGIQVVLPGIVLAGGELAGTDTGESTAELLSGYFGKSADVIRTAYRLYDEAIRGAAERHGAVYLPTDSFGLHEERYYATGDPIHFNDSGADRMARFLARDLLEAGLIDASGPSRCRATFQAPD